MASNIAFADFNPIAILSAAPSRLAQVLEQLFPYLLAPGSPSRVVYDYVAAIKDIVQEGRPPPSGKASLGFNPFDRIAIRVGIVKTFFQIAKDPRKDMERVFTSYFAAEALWSLVEHGTPSERREIIQKYLEHGVVDMLLEQAGNGDFVAHRSIATVGFRTLSLQCYLGDYLSTQKTSEVIIAMCRVILAGPDTFIKQMKDPKTTWQSFFCFGTVGAPTTKAAEYAPRYYAMCQENAAWAIHDVLCRHPCPSQQYFNEVIQHDVELLELLLQCAKTPREPWYGVLEVDSLISESLSLLFHVSVDAVPGIEAQVENKVIQKKEDEEWKAVMDGLKILTSVQNWAPKIVNIWNHIEDEDLVALKVMLKSAKKSYHALDSYSDEVFYNISEYRGCCRISVQRLITTITHAAESPDNSISDTDLLLLLPIGHSASQNVKKLEQIRSEKDAFDILERDINIFRIPLVAAVTEEAVERIIQIPDEVVMGPTCHARLLTALAKRGLIEKVQQWTALPPNMPSSVSLKKLKQITSPEGIRSFLQLSLERLTARRELGHRRFRESKLLDYAGFAYYNAAELAAALVAFDEATNGSYAGLIRGARQEAVLSLGNAAEMALGMKHFPRALVFASSAVKLGANLPVPESIEGKIQEKNQRRIDRALSAL